MGSVRILDAGFHHDLPAEGGGFGEKWKKYLADVLTEYFWDRHNRVDTTNYYWTKYNRADTTQYIWNRYNVVTTENYDATKSTIQTSTLSTLLDLYGSKPLYKPFSPTTWTGTKTGYTLTEFKETGANSELIGQYLVVSSTKALQFSQTSGSNSLKYYIWEKGDLVSTEYSKGATKYSDSTSTNRSSYPDDGKSGSYWYVYSSSTITYSKGSTSYGEVTSTDRSTYPDNNYVDAYWYVYSRSDVTYSKGTTDYGEIKSTDRSAYPDNSYSGTTWYTYDRAETSDIPGDLVGEVVDYRTNVYPDNGKHADGYYYIKL